MAIRYELQIIASQYVIMTASDVIYFSRIINPLLTPTLCDQNIKFNVVPNSKNSAQQKTPIWVTTAK